MNKDNTEGTSEPEGSVESRRETSVSKEQLQQGYETAGSLRKLGEMYGVGFKKARKMLDEAGVPVKPRGHVKGSKKSDAWREASARHWNDPAWRAQQREQWLERLPSMRKGRGGSPAEKLLQNALKKARISFEANAVVLDGRYVADILIKQQLVILEADGSSHYLKHARESDAQRTADLEAEGYRVVRFGYEELSANADVCVTSLGLIAEEHPVFSVRSDAQAIGERMNKKREDPEWREKWLANLRAAQQRRRERERGGR